MKYGFLATAAVAGLITVNAAYADDPEDKIIAGDNNPGISSTEYTAIINDQSISVDIDRQILAELQRIRGILETDSGRVRNVPVRESR